MQLLGHVDNDIVGVTGLLKDGRVAGISKTEAVTLRVCNFMERILELRLGFKETNDAGVFVADKLLKFGHSLKFLCRWAGL